MYLIAFLVSAMACNTENTRATQTKRMIFVKVIKLRKLLTMSSFKLFCLEPLPNLIFLKTMTATLNTKERISIIVMS